MNKLFLLSIFLQLSIFNYQQLPDCHLVHRVCPFSGTARKWISPWKELGAVSASRGLETVLKPSRCTRSASPLTCPHHNHRHHSYFTIANFFYHRDGNEKSFKILLLSRKSGRDRLQLKKPCRAHKSERAAGGIETFLNDFETLMVQELSVGQGIGNSFKTPGEDLRRDAAG